VYFLFWRFRGPPLEVLHAIFVLFKWSRGDFAYFTFVVLFLDGFCVEVGPMGFPVLFPLSVRGSFPLLPFLVAMRLGVHEEGALVVFLS